MTRESLRIVIVGHVDHGKSTLIGRLFFDTGSLPADKLNEIQRISRDLGHSDVEFAFLMDHLQEERDQGITIDTAQTFFKTQKRDYVIIDAPGHRQFLKNMITGASQAETALLVIDAKEGVREQTTRHAYILSLLGLDQIICVLNKMDQVRYSEERFNAVNMEICHFLETIAIEPSMVIPISALKGDNVAGKSNNMAWYTGPTVLDALDLCTRLEPEQKPCRFPVQDIYTIPSGLRIIAGRPEAGTVRAGQELLILPHGIKTSVSRIEKYMEDTISLSTGESGGLILSDQVPVSRGDVLVDPEAPPPVSTNVKAHVFWMSPEPLKTGERLTFRCTTQQSVCSVREIVNRIDSSSLELLGTESESMNNTEVGELLIETENPVIVEKHADIPQMGQFVLERDQNVVAGGIIV